jgi:ankyrin repeat protein
MKKYWVIILSIILISCNSKDRANLMLEDGILEEDFGIVKQALDNGADANHIDISDNYVICDAVLDCQIEIIKLLVEKGANVDISCDDSPLLADVMPCNNLELVQILVEKGAKINILDDLGSPPLAYGISLCNDEIVKYLLEKDADKNLKDEDGFLPVTYATTKERVQFLEKLGFDTNPVTDDGITFLMKAVEGNDYQVAKYLIEEKKVDINIKSNDGKTARDFLKPNQDIDMRLLLEKHYGK